MDYLNALERVILYIESHLDEAVTAEAIARCAGYSYYHFSRQFSAVLGESVGSYIKKRRLSEAAKQLIYSERKIIDIAIESGFSSSEAFSRAFKTAYKTSPYNYRKRRLDILIASKDILDKNLLRHRISNMTVHPKIVRTTEIMAAGIRGQTTLADNVVPELWSKFMNIVDRVPNRIHKGRGFGICEAVNEGNQITTMNRDAVFSEVAAIEVDSFAGLKHPFVPKDLEAGKYAVFTHRGSLAQLEDTFRYIWGTWFISEGEEVDAREDFEMYDERYLGYDHPRSEFDIYIPIK